VFRSVSRISIIIIPVKTEIMFISRDYRGVAAILAEWGRLGNLVLANPAIMRKISEWNVFRLFVVALARRARKLYVSLSRLMIGQAGKPDVLGAG
jgi:hypothetical protein